jgi:hypothetical protein
LVSMSRVSSVPEPGAQNRPRGEFRELLRVGECFSIVGRDGFAVTGPAGVERRDRR